MEKHLWDHMGIQGDPSGDPMGIAWTYNGCPPYGNTMGSQSKTNGNPYGNGMGTPWA